MAAFEDPNKKKEDLPESIAENLVYGRSAFQSSRLPVIMDSKTHHEERMEDSIKIRYAKNNHTAFIPLQGNRAQGSVLFNGLHAPSITPQLHKDNSYPIDTLTKRFGDDGPNPIVPHPGNCSPGKNILPADVHNYQHGSIMPFVRTQSVVSYDHTAPSNSFRHGQATVFGIWNTAHGVYHDRQTVHPVILKHIIAYQSRQLSGAVQPNTKQVRSGEAGQNQLSKALSRVLQLNQQQLFMIKQKLNTWAKDATNLCYQYERDSNFTAQYIKEQFSSRLLDEIRILDGRNEDVWNEYHNIAPFQKEPFNHALRVVEHEIQKFCNEFLQSFNLALPNLVNSGLGLIFHRFPNLPPELRNMIWKWALGIYSPRFVIWGEDRYPAAAKACKDPLGMWEADLTYWKEWDDERCKVHLGKHDTFYFGHRIPGLKIQRAQTWAMVPVPVQMTPSRLLWPATKSDQFADMPLRLTISPSPLWMSNITSFAVCIHVAFVHFRGSSVAKSDDNWNEVVFLFPKLRIMALLSRTDPTRTATAKPVTSETCTDDMIYIKKEQLDKERKRNPEQHWADQIMHGYRRNRRNGTIPRPIAIKYAKLK